MKFKASLSSSSKIITILVGALLIGVNAPILLFDFGAFWVTLGILILTVSILIISWGYSVSGYKIENVILTISSPFGKKNFPLQNIRRFERVDAKDLRFSIRTFGNGGFMGYYGKFWNKKFGGMTWYATNLNNAVLLTLNDGRKIVVTPDEPEKMLQAISTPK